MESETLKKEVQNFWQNNPCGSLTTNLNPGSKEYFDAIESYRYKEDPTILSFAAFPRFHGKKVLEVGVGLGTDFLQWVRSGALATGVDLTEAGVESVRQRLQMYGFKAEKLVRADCENLPFDDNQFDVVYSWGVLMHTPNTEKALAELVRVLKPGGIGKIMVYNRHSLGAFYLWVRHALLKGRPWKSFAWCLYHFQESKGTKGYTTPEVKSLLDSAGVKNFKIQSYLTNFDQLGASQKVLVRLFGRLVKSVFGKPQNGWHMTVEFKKEVAAHRK